VNTPSPRRHRFPLSTTVALGLWSLLTVLLGAHGAHASASRPSITLNPVSQTVLANANVSFTVNASSGKVQWSVSTDGGVHWAPLPGGTATKLRLSATTSMNGWEYEAIVSNAAGSATSSPATLTVTPLLAPVITASPASASLAAIGSTVSFSSGATGVPTPVVSWSYSRDGGATWIKTGPRSTTLTVAVKSLSMNGYQYRASFTNAKGLAVTSAATLTVAATQLPRVVTNPTSAFAYASHTATFSASVNDPSATVQWRQSSDGGVTWSAIDGATSTVLTMSGLSVTQSGLKVEAVFTNNVGSITSGTATLTVAALPLPRVVHNPVNQTVDEGSSVTFSAESSDGTASVQWLVSTDNGTTYSPINGATTATLTLTNLTVSQSGELIEVVFTNATGSATSLPAALRVRSLAPAPPTMTQQPANQYTFANQPVSFSSLADGMPTATAQWSVSSNGGYTWDAIPGATSPTYSFTANQLDSGKWFEVTYSNAIGSVTSTAAVLTVWNPSAQVNLNWSGYVATGQTFTSVSGSWTVPTVTCVGTTNANVSQWVGIDGIDSAQVEQVGTDSSCNYFGPFYNAWWEMYGDTTAPDGAFYFEVGLPIATYPVQPGDVMNASVSVTDGVWNMTIVDVTEGWNYTKLVGGANPTPLQSCAEWIVERSGIVIGGVQSIGTTASSTPVTITDATASTASMTGSISSFTSQPFNVTNPQTGQPLLTTGPLSSDGSSFTVVNTSPVS